MEIQRDVEFTQNSHNVATLEFKNIRKGWKTSILLSSDRHHDSVKCDRELELEHLKEVKSRKAFILDVGDCFDAMEGRYDPRRTYSELRPEYKLDNYLDEIVQDAAQFYGPYAANFLIFGRGNHEQSVLKHSSVDLTSNLVHELNSKYGGHIQVGGYTGWLRVLLVMHGTRRDSVMVKYAHGFGGTNAPVTRGVIQTNRQAVYEPDALVVINGHNHESWLMPIARERLSHTGEIYSDIQYHIRTGTYSDDYGDGYGGHAVESGAAPKPRGAVWLNLAYYSDKITVEPVLAIK